MKLINYSGLAFYSLIFTLPLRHLHSYYYSISNLFLFRGFASILSFTLVAIIGFLYPWEKKKAEEWFGVFLFFIVVSFAYANIFFSPNEVSTFGKQALEHNSITVAYYVVFFIIGLKINKVAEFKNLIILFWIIMFLNLTLHFDYNHFRISFEGFSGERLGIYLFLADSFAIWSILAASVLCSNPAKSSFIIVFSFIALFAFNSRSSLYTFLIIIPIFLLINKRSLKYTVILFCTLAILLPLIGVNFEKIESVNSRMMAIQNLADDGSFVIRKELQQRGLKDLRDNWFWGNYNGQLAYGGLGAYIHNYLSLWRQFGFIPFVCFIILVFLLIRKIFTLNFKLCYQKKTLSPEDFFLVLGSVFCVIEIAVARSFVSPYVWLFIGMSIQNRPSVGIPACAKQTNKNIRLQ